MIPLFKHISHNAFKLLKENTSDQLKSLNISNYYIYDWDDSEIRILLSIPINNTNIAFYRSSKGTSGKTMGEWYPVFGVGNGGWLIKGTKTHMMQGYGIPEFKSIMNKLNTIFPTNMPITNIISIIKSTLGKPDISTKAFMKNTYGNIGVNANLSKNNPHQVYDHINNIVSNFGIFFSKELFKDTCK